MESTADNITIRRRRRRTTTTISGERGGGDALCREQRQREEARWMNTARTADRGLSSTTPQTIQTPRNHESPSRRLPGVYTSTFLCIILLQIFTTTTVSAVAVNGIYNPKSDSLTLSFDLFRRQESTCSEACKFCCGPTCMNDGKSENCWGRGNTWTIFATTTITASTTKVVTIYPAVVTSTIKSNVFLSAYETRYTTPREGENEPRATKATKVKRQNATILPTVTVTRTVTFTPTTTVLPAGESTDPNEPTRTVLTTSLFTVITTFVANFPPGYVDPEVKAARKRAQDRKVAIAGGVVGGLIGLGIIAGLLWWLRERFQKNQFKKAALKEIDEAARMSPTDRMAETPWPSCNGDIVTIDEEVGVVSPSTSKPPSLHLSHRQYYLLT